MRASVFLAYSKVECGVHILTSVDKGAYLIIKDTNIGIEVVSAFKTSDLCVVYIIPKHKSVDDILDSTKFGNMLLETICALTNEPVDLVFRLLHSGPHVLRLVRFVHNFYERVNKVLKGSSTIVAID